MNQACKKFSVGCWNVRGLGDSSKCFNVHNNLSSIFCLQKTKLTSVDATKARSFLPFDCDAFVAKHSGGAFGGLLTAWCLCTILLVSSAEHDFTQTCLIESVADNLRFSMTNVFAPYDVARRSAFLEELANIAETSNAPWILLGDLNIALSPDDKNTHNFDAAAAAFSGKLKELRLQELPLLDRHYTWSTATPRLLCSSTVPSSTAPGGRCSSISRFTRSPDPPPITPPWLSPPPRPSQLHPSSGTSMVGPSTLTSVPSSLGS